MRAPTSRVGCTVSAGAAGAGRRSTRLPALAAMTARGVEQRKARRSAARRCLSSHERVTELLAIGRDDVRLARLLASGGSTVPDHGIPSWASTTRPRGRLVPRSGAVEVGASVGSARDTVGPSAPPAPPGGRPCQEQGIGIPEAARCHGTTGPTTGPSEIPPGQSRWFHLDQRPAELSRSPPGIAASLASTAKDLIDSALKIAILSDSQVRPEDRNSLVRATGAAEYTEATQCPRPSESTSAPPTRS